MMMYHGIELKEVTEQQVFDPPKEMLVWDYESCKIYKRCVCAIASKRLEFPVLTIGGTYRHCAEIPERKSVTYRELSRWLAEGKGELRLDSSCSNCSTYVCYPPAEANIAVSLDWNVRKWDDTEWHKPTREYLGLEG